MVHSSPPPHARFALSSVTLAMVAAAALAAARGLPFVLWPHAFFDSDQAITGLMAKHLAEGRAVPLFYYGQSYLLAVQAWIAAPLFLMAGASVPLLKLPLLAINAIAGALLVRLLVRDARLSAAMALAASAFFILCPPIVGSLLTAAWSASVEPFLYVLLIWLLRDRPVLCGVVAGIGFLHREFTAYGLSALFVTQIVHQWRQWRELAGRWLLIGAVFLTVLEVAQAARPIGDAFGPEMPKFQAVAAASNFGGIAARVECSEGRDIAANFMWLIERNLPTIAGTRGRGTNEYFVGPSTAPNPIVWMMLCAGLAVALIRSLTLAVGKRAPVAPFLVFLFLVGLQAGAMFVVGCNVRDPTLIRYTLLTLFIPVAVAATYLRLETVRPLRWLAVLLLAAWTAWSAAGYISMGVNYAANPPSSPQAIMAAELDRRGIRYGHASYWDAHHITFLTNERVVLASSYPQRIYTYDTVVSRAADVVYVQRNPCEGELIGSLWLCR